MPSINLLISRIGKSSCAQTLTLAGILAGICLSSLGCKIPQAVWSAEAESPDGKMVATAEAFANGGFGISGTPATFVYLNWATGSQKPTEILALSNESDTPTGEAVGIKWLSPGKLEVTYSKDKQQIDFQAIKFLNVEIDVRDLSTNSPDGR